MAWAGSFGVSWAPKSHVNPLDSHAGTAALTFWLEIGCPLRNSKQTCYTKEAGNRSPPAGNAESLSETHCSPSHDVSVSCFRRVQIEIG